MSRTPAISMDFLSRFFIKVLILLFCDEMFKLYIATGLSSGSDHLYFSKDVVITFVKKSRDWSCKPDQAKLSSTQEKLGVFLAKPS